MEPVVTIPLSEYEELLRFKRDNTIVIECVERTVFSSYVSHISENFRIRIDGSSDAVRANSKLMDTLNAFINRYEAVKRDIVAESLRLALLEKQVERVPLWVVKLFNRKQK